MVVAQPKHVLQTSFEMCGHLNNSYYHFTHLLAVGIIAKSVVFLSIQMAQNKYTYVFISN